MSLQIPLTRFPKTRMRTACLKSTLFQRRTWGNWVTCRNFQTRRFSFASQRAFPRRRVFWQVLGSGVLGASLAFAIGIRSAYAESKIYQENQEEEQEYGKYKRNTVKDVSKSHNIHLFEALVRTPLAHVLDCIILLVGIPTLGVLWLLRPYFEWAHYQESIRTIGVPGVPGEWQFECELREYYEEAFIRFGLAVLTGGSYILFGFSARRHAQFLDNHIKHVAD
eukprot:36782_1